MSDQQIQTGTDGLPIPIVYGQIKFTPNLIWFVDFTPTKPRSRRGGDGSGIAYTYRAGEPV